MEIKKVIKERTSLLKKNKSIMDPNKPNHFHSDEFKELPERGF